MRTLLERYAPLRAPENDGGAAAAPGAASPGDGGQAPPAGGSAPPAQAAAPAPAGADPYRVDGLPETMFGDDDRGTIDKLANAVKGYRDRDAARGVPDKPDAYGAFQFDTLPDTIRPHIEGLAKDPLFAAVSKVALDEKIPAPAFQKLTAALYEAGQNAGLLEPPVDAAAERAQLLPEAAKNLAPAEQDAAIDKRLAENEQFVKLLAQPGQDGKALIEAKDAEHVLLMLMDSAAGNRFLEAFRANMTGDKLPQPHGGDGGGGPGGDQAAQLRAELAKPEMQPQHPAFDRARYDQLLAEYRKHHGA